MDGDGHETGCGLWTRRMNSVAQVGVNVIPLYTQDTDLYGVLLCLSCSCRHPTTLGLQQAKQLALNLINTVCAACTPCATVVTIIVVDDDGGGGGGVHIAILRQHCNTVAHVHRLNGMRKIV